MIVKKMNNFVNYTTNLLKSLTALSIIEMYFIR